jgi:hypothetical protein
MPTIIPSASASAAKILRSRRFDSRQVFCQFEPYVGEGVLRSDATYG